MINKKKLLEGYQSSHYKQFNFDVYKSLGRQVLTFCHKSHTNGAVVGKEKNIFILDQMLC